MLLSESRSSPKGTLIDVEPFVTNLFPTCPSNGFDRPLWAKFKLLRLGLFPPHGSVEEVSVEVMAGENRKEDLMAWAIYIVKGHTIRVPYAGRFCDDFYIGGSADVIAGRFRRDINSNCVQK